MNNTKRKAQSFLQGSAVLLAATALVKLIGAAFRIPLTGLLGEVGMGYFSTSYDLYLPIYALAMGGLPVALARIVAVQVTSQHYRDARKTLRVAKKAFFITGIISFLIMLIATYPFVVITKNDGSLLGILAIAPSLLFCCMVSTYRGYYEGLRNMYPTAVSSVIEAMGKLVLGYGFAFAIIKISGNTNTKTLSLAAAGALMGITVGTLAGAIYLIIRHKKIGDGFTREELLASPKPRDSSKILKTLIAIAIPVVLGSLVTNIASLIDVTMVQRQLVSVMNNSGEILKSMYSDLIASNSLSDSEIPNALYGCYKGYAFSIYNLAPAITTVLGVSALPVLASAWTRRDKPLIKLNIQTMIKTTAMIAMPMGIGITVLASPIMRLLYPTQPIGVAVATPLLQTLGITAVFAGMVFPLTNMLQAIGKERIPVLNIAVGAVLKIIVNFILVGIPSVNIKGAPVGTLVCYGYIAISNYICLIKYSGVMPSIVKTVIKPLAAALLCGAAAWGSFAACIKILSVGEKLATVISIIVAGVIYVLALILLRVIEKSDILSLPKGEKIAKRLEKMNIIK